MYISIISRLCSVWVCVSSVVYPINLKKQTPAVWVGSEREMAEAAILRT